MNALSFRLQQRKCEIFKLQRICAINCRPAAVVPLLFLTSRSVTRNSTTTMSTSGCVCLLMFGEFNADFLFDFISVTVIYSYLFITLTLSPLKSTCARFSANMSSRVEICVAAFHGKWLLILLCFDFLSHLGLNSMKYLNLCRTAFYLRTRYSKQLISWFLSLNLKRNKARAILFRKNSWNLTAINNVNYKCHETIFALIKNYKMPSFHSTAQRTWRKVRKHHNCIKTTDFFLFTLRNDNLTEDLCMPSKYPSHILWVSFYFFLIIIDYFLLFKYKTLP